MNKTHINRQNGITLVELLVAIALQGFILLILSQLYVSDKQVSRYQSELAALQESGRYVSNQIISDIHSAGFSGCRNLDELSPNIIAKDFSGYSSITDALMLFDGGTGWIAPTGFSHQPNTDVIKIRYAGPGAYLTGNMSTENANVQVTRNPGNLQAGDLVLITDCQDSDIFRATSVSNGSTVTIAHANNMNTTNKLSKKYRENAQIFAFRDVEYFLGSEAGTSGLYQLFSNGTPVLLANNITDFEITLTTDTDGIATGMQYGLLMTTQDNLTTTAQPFTFDGATVNSGPAADRRLRKAFWSFANLRNNSP